MNAQATDNPNKVLALALATAGVPVFPCLEADGKNKGAKAPYTRNGFKDATTDRDQIKRWWSKWRNAVPGIPTGAASGLAVIDCDIDRTTGETIGEDQVTELGLDRPDVVHVRTQSGGLHVYFMHVAGVRSSAKKIASNVDVRAEGGYVIAPGARMASGAEYACEGRSLLDALQAGDLPAFPVEAVRAAIDARKGRASKGGKRQADDQKTSGAKATEEETIEVLCILLAEAPNTLNRTDWVKLALSLRDAFGEKLRDAFMEFSLRYKGETPCTPEAAEKVWDSANTTTEIKGPGTALYLLKGAVGKARFKEIWRDVFSRTRGDRPDERDLSHDALALALGRDSFDLDARFVASFGAKGWLFWTGTRWEQDASLQHMTRARDYLRERAKSLIAWAEEVDDGEGKLIKWAKQKAETIRHKTTVAAVESLARSNPATAASADAFDTDVMLLGTPGGTVDLRTGELREARREDLITKQTTVAPAPEGTLPERWLTFLNEVFDGDKEVVEFMQRAAGYALTGLTTEHKLLFLYGTGRNGKSVLLNTLTHIWGDYATRAAAETFLSSHAEKHPTVLAKLHRARLVVGSELPPGKRWDEAVIKDLTGGDRMAARFMRGNYFDFDPQLTLMIAGNNQPSFRGVDEALRARMVLVPFTVTIPPEKRDPDLGEKLKAEAPAILRWAIEGALAWQKRGLDVPAQLAVASQEYMDSEDIVGQFLGDETVREPNGFVSTTEMHRRFEEWRSEQGLQKSWTTRALQKALAKRAGLETWRTNTSRGFKGLVLKGRPGRNAGEVAISDEVQKKALEIKGSARREPFIKTAPAAAAEPSSAPADGGATPIRRHDIREE